MNFHSYMATVVTMTTTCYEELLHKM